MLRNFIKTAYRNLLRNKSYTLLNVIGLGIGIGCSIVIYNIISYEMSFDKHQTNYDEIFRVYREGGGRGGEFKEASSPYTVSYTLRQDYPGIKTGMFNYIGDGLFIFDGTDGFRERMTLEGVTCAEPEILEMIDIDIILGDKSLGLSDKNTIAFSRSDAKKIFGLSDENLSDAMGRVVNLNHKADLVVRGIYEDLPENSEFNFKSIISYESLGDLDNYFDITKWGTVDSNNFCYVLTDPANKEILEEKFLPINDKYYGDWEDFEVFYKLQPLSDIHFNDEFYNASETIVDKQSMFILIGIVFILILTSCVNFINLSTALIVVRSKEIGIRKTIGSSRTLLVLQFLTETFLITTLSVILGLVIAEVLNVNLSDLLGNASHVNVLNNPEVLLFLGMLMLIIILFSGLYPAFVLSNIKAASVLKISMNSGNNKGLNVRRALVIFQFVVAQLLIFGTLVLHYQMDYFHNKNLGFKKESVMNVRLPEADLEKSKQFQSMLLERPEIAMTSLNLSPPTGRSNFTISFKYEPLESMEITEANFKVVDENYIGMYGLNLLAGRNLRFNETQDKIIINEKTMKYMGFDDPNEVLGEKIVTEAMGFLGGTIIGVIEDFHVYSLKREIPFTVLVNNVDMKRNMSIKINPNTDLHDLLPFIESSWNEVYPENIYAYSFLDEALKASYETEKNITTLIKIFAVITILIGCLGLYGLISFVANEKTKEIGIRKVLGATLVNILNLFSKEIIYLTLLAFLVSAPFGYYLLSSFLQDFHYRIDLGPMFFIASLALTLIVSIFTVGYKSYSTATQNPINSLKDE